MIISNEKAESRLNNPMNLINRMNELRNKVKKQNGAMSLFGVRRNINSITELSKMEEGLEERLQDKKENKLAVAGVPFVNPYQKITKPKLQTSDRILQTAPINTPSINTPSLNTPRIDDLLENSDNKIKLASAHNNALDLLNDAVAQLKTKLDDVGASRLPSVITAASKVVESIRKERVEIMKTGKDKEVHYHFYTPETRKIEQYEVIDV